MDTLIGRLEAAGARYVVIGGQAIRLHGLPRFSMDWDLFIPPRDTANLLRIQEALGEELDMDLLPLGPRGEDMIQTYQTRFGIVQFHLAVPGLPSFDDAERRAVSVDDEDGQAVRVVCAEDLLAAKTAVDRVQDREDAAYLRALLDQRNAS
jgi:hypothetical protein